MAQFTVEKYIEAPREVVFDAALDLHSAAENIRGIEKLEVLTEPRGSGQNRPVVIGSNAASWSASGR